MASCACSPQPTQKKHLDLVREDSLDIMFFTQSAKETGSLYVALSDLELTILTILLPQPLECWDYRHVPLPLVKIYFEESWKISREKIQHQIRSGNKLVNKS
jgi:hypothetical protein